MNHNDDLLHRPFTDDEQRVGEWIGHRLSILELEGLGAELWAGVDPKQYIDELRNEWRERGTESTDMNRNNSDGLWHRPFTDDEQRVGEWIGNALAAGAVFVLGLIVLWSLTGCAALNPRPPVEALAEKLVDEAIIPAIREGMTAGVQQLTIQAGAQAINPGYVVTFEGKWVVGLEGRATIGVEGMSGQLQMGATAPGPSTQPVEPPP